MVSKKCLALALYYGVYWNCLGYVTSQYKSYPKTPVVSVKAVIYETTVFFLVFLLKPF